MGIKKEMPCPDDGQELSGQEQPENV